MLKRTLLKRLAVVAAGWLLFAQPVIAAGSCMMRVEALLGIASGAAMAMEGCAAAPAAPATCLSHCLKASEPASYSADYQFHAFAAPIAAPGQLTLLSRPDFSALPQHVPELRGSPPLNVLFCSFQI